MLQEQGDRNHAWDDSLIPGLLEIQRKVRNRLAVFVDEPTQKSLRPGR